MKVWNDWFSESEYIVQIVDGEGYSQHYAEAIWDKGAVDPKSHKWDENKGLMLLYSELAEYRSFSNEWMNKEEFIWHAINIEKISEAKATVIWNDCIKDARLVSSRKWDDSRGWLLEYGNTSIS